MKLNIWLTIVVLITGLYVFKAVSNNTTEKIPNRQVEKTIKESVVSNVALPIPQVVILTLPDISSYYRLDGRVQRIDEALKQLVPDGMSLEANYVTEADNQAVQGGKFPSLQHAISIMSFKKVRGIFVGQDAFDKYKKTVESDMAGMKSGLNEYSKPTEDKLNAFVKGEAEFKYLNIIPCGVCNSTQTSITASTLTKSSSTDKGGVTVMVQATTICTVLAGGKMVSIYTYAVYETPSDLKWTQDQALAVRDLVAAANPF